MAELRQSVEDREREMEELKSRVDDSNKEHDKEVLRLKGENRTLSKSHEKQINDLTEVCVTVFRSLIYIFALYRFSCCIVCRRFTKLKCPPSRISSVNLRNHSVSSSYSTMLEPKTVIFMYSNLVCKQNPWNATRRISTSKC